MPRRSGDNVPTLLKKCVGSVFTDMFVTDLKYIYILQTIGVLVVFFVLVARPWKSKKTCTQNTVSRILCLAG